MGSPSCGFFEPLRDAGLFAPERNPAPEPAPDQGYVRIPYWGALDYLFKVAIDAGKRNDVVIANRMMDIVRAISGWREADGEPRHNYQTARRFTEIIGHLPTSTVTKSDVELLSTWLNDRFERMLVAVAIDETLLPHLLASTSPEDWDKAVTVMHQATAIKWIEEPGISGKTARTVIDDYWLEQILLHHVQSLAVKLPRDTAQLFENRVRDVYATDLHKEHSSIYRPAIEDNAQNHQFRAAENRMVEALRDALGIWAANEPKAAKSYLAGMLHGDVEILRRIAIHVLNQHWSTMNSLYLPFAKGEPFHSGHLHELYALLAMQFTKFTGPECEATINALRHIPTPKYAKDPELARKHLQRRWLTAIVGKGSKQADDWMDELSADPSVGPPPPHPDFTSYMTSSWGPGESPYTMEELVGFAEAHLLSDRLNDFAESGTWGSPTLDGLTSTLQNAVRANPATFLRALPDLVGAKSGFQQAVVRGLQQAWEAKEQSALFNWDDGWEQLISFFEQLAVTPTPDADEGNQHKWALAAVADALRAGTQDDEHAYAPALLPRGQAIINKLLERLPAETKLSDDPMSTAINTPKGRVIEALFSHVLRACRVADQTTGNHTSTWVQLQPIFERELSTCRDNNVEFSTLCAAYLAQLEYADPGWTTKSIPSFFPADSPVNDQAAIAGLAYAAFTRRIYEHLDHYGIIDRGLQYDLKAEAHEKLLERVAAAYIWGIETLDSARFQAIFSTATAKELEHITWVLWTLRHPGIDDEQRERILAFWSRCVTWSQNQTAVPASLLSALSALATYIVAVDERARALLLAVAPFVGIEHHAYEFFNELLRLVEQDSAVIADVVAAVIQAHRPEYDYESRLQRLLKALAAKGEKNQVFRILERMPAMHHLYNELAGEVRRPEPPFEHH
jgi:hypothetical protein